MSLQASALEDQRERKKTLLSLRNVDYINDATRCVNVASRKIIDTGKKLVNKLQERFDLRHLSVQVTLKLT